MLSTFQQITMRKILQISVLLFVIKTLKTSTQYIKKIVSI